MANITVGHLLTGLLFKYVENYDYEDIPVACFKHKDTGGEWLYNLIELQDLVKKCKTLGITNEELNLGIIDLVYAQDQFNRIKPVDQIHSFFH
jgi:hypothetical protein